MASVQDALSAAALLEFVEVDTARVDRLLQLFDSNSLIRTVYEIAMAGLLAGGIRFTDEKGNVVEDASSIPAEIWSLLIKDMVRQLWCVGFTAVVMYEDSGEAITPRVLDLSMLTVKYRRDCVGNSTYMFFPRPNLRKQDGGGDFLKPVKFHKVFEHSAPSALGALRSLLNSLLPDFEYYDDINNAYTHAIKEMADPAVMVAQALPATSTTLEEKMNVGDARNMLGGGGLPPRESLEVPVVVAQAAHRDAARVNGTLPAETDFEEEERKLGDKLVRLRPGSTVQRQVLPEIPYHVDESRVPLEERVGATFFVPRSMFANSKTGNRTTTEETRIVYLEGQKRLKAMIVGFIDQVHAYMVAYPAVRNRLRKAAVNATEPVSSEIAKVTAKTHVNLPGIPPLEQLDVYYQMGVLEYKAYCEYVGAALSLPMSCFNKQADPPATEYIEPVVPAAKGGGSGGRKRASGGGGASAAKGRAAKKANGRS